MWVGEIDFLLSRHTLMLYQNIVHHFKESQVELKHAAESKPLDYSLEIANKHIQDLEANLSRLNDTNNCCYRSFVVGNAILMQTACRKKN